ncbi:MAG: hypothetical protein DME13_09170 [Candidatus Rokuibacteriota bacterium]|nr:MAG: hypothetical protein DME13_09170 [Candidatus Rokubacteria bacterium]
MLHLDDARPQQVVHVLVAGAAPHLPERALGEAAHTRVGVAQGGQQHRHVGHGSRLGQRRGRAAADLDVAAVGETGQRVLAWPRHRRPRHEHEQQRQRCPHGV